MDNGLTSVTIYTLQFKVQGQVVLPPEGYRSRVSDLLNKEVVQFIPLLNARVCNLKGEVIIASAPVIVINKEQITLVLPEPEEE